MFAKVWKELNNQTQVLRETEFTEFQLILTKCLHIVYTKCLYNCRMVRQKKLSFFTVVHPVTTFLFRENLRVLSELLQNYVFHIFM